ncbi:Laccase-3 [Hibiscus syriacus]|uniref:Laccase-3 n=1 Tax=Hibiscus syriacus TaxID=106335 RepID=A0A6A3CID9_HIBSY|nr:Laccase-3 [Hibiscus syriacus]
MKTKLTDQSLKAIEYQKLSAKPCSSCLFFTILLLFAFLASFADAAVHFHEFVIEAKPVKRLCRTHSTITVNGQFPGRRWKWETEILWHGVRQLRNPWADGPEFVTQCPIRPGQSYTYQFTIQNREGTLWWHAHSRWLRATVYGALIIYPKLGSPYPFPMPKNPMDVLRLALFTGAAPNVSDALTINGQPGDLYRCSSKGETIFLRIVNSGMNQEMFFAPGQTTDVLLTADQTPACYYMAAHAYNTASPLTIPLRLQSLNINLLRAVQRKGNLKNQSSLSYQGSQRHGHYDCIHCTTKESLDAKAPMELLNAGLLPRSARYLHHRLPAFPPAQIDYSGNVPRGLWQPIKATKLFKLKYRSKVQIVFQDTNIVTVEDHPMHLHGYQFYVVGSGFGNFNPKTDPAKFNLIDPPERNTIGTPPGGWVAIRFEADNPAFLVENGVGKLQTVQTPPLDLP